MDYLKLTKFYNNLESTSKRLEKTYIISKFLKDVKKTDLDHLIYLIQGKVFPPWDERKIGFSGQLIIKALATSTGNESKNIEKLWAKRGDLGEVASELTKGSKQSTLFSRKISTRKVFDNIRKLSTLEGEGTVNRKVSLVSELLTASSGEEAKFIIRLILEDMRMGVAAGTLRDAITWRFFSKEIELNYDPKTNKVELNREKYNYYSDKVRHAYDLTTDFGKVLEILLDKGEKGLEGINLEVGRPLNVMLYQKVSTVEDAFKTVGKPCAIEFKYDGWRCLVHIKDDKVKLFTRNLEDVTKQFPDVVSHVKRHVKAKQCILDGEVIGFDPKTKKWLAFQAISQRIRRKYRIEELAKKIPVILQVFDVLEYNGKDMLKENFSERRKTIERIVKVEKNKVEIAKQIITDSAAKAEKFYKEALKLGNEGVMFKNLEGVYKPGSRVGYGVKLKPTLDRLDLVITKAEWGTGKRAKWLSSFTLACIDNGDFLEIGNVGTGVKEKGEGVTFDELTKLLNKFMINEKGKVVTVKPKVIVEIDYEEIQKSNNYSSGYALRFPRVVRLRYGDKRVEQATSLKEIEKIYAEQRGRNR